MTTTSSIVGLDESDKRLLPGGEPAPLGRVGRAVRRAGIGVGVAGIVLVPLAGGVASAAPSVPFPPNPVLTAPVHPPTIPPKPICVPCVHATKMPPVVVVTGAGTPSTPPAPPATPAATTPAPTPATPKHSTGTSTGTGTGTGKSTGSTTGSTGTDAVSNTDPGTAGDDAPLPPVTDPADPAGASETAGATGPVADGGARGGTHLAGSHSTSGPADIPLLAGGGALVIGGLGGLVWFATRRRTAR